MPPSLVDTPPLTIAFIAGLLSFISPCVLPLVPAYIGYLGARVGGQATGELAFAGAGPAPSASATRVQVFLHGLMFVLGFTFVFVVFGLAVNTGLKLLGVSSYDLQNTIARVGGLIIIFFGLHVMGVTRLIITFLVKHTASDSTAGRLLGRLQSLLYADTRFQMNPRNNYGYAGSALMGTVFAAGWTPCVGPIYGSILTVASTGSTTSAAVLLTAYSLGLGLPFLAAAIGINQIKPLLRRIQKRMRLIEIFSGLLLILMGYLLYSNQLGEISGRLTGLADFSYKVEECTVRGLEGKMPWADYNTCMELGANYQYRITPTPNP
jgi:cytochrome c-type biogenesis protein